LGRAWLAEAAAGAAGGDSPPASVRAFAGLHALGVSDGVDALDGAFHMYEGAEAEEVSWRAEPSAAAAEPQRGRKLRAGVPAMLAACTAVIVVHAAEATSADMSAYVES